MEQYVEEQKEKKNLEEILLRQYFSTRSWEDGKWMFIAPPPGANQQYFMCEVIFPRFSAINHQHSGYLALVWSTIFCGIFGRMGVDVYCSRSISSCPSSQYLISLHPLWSPLEPEAIFARTKFHLDAVFCKPSMLLNKMRKARKRRHNTWSFSLAPHTGK